MITVKSFPELYIVFRYRHRAQSIIQYQSLDQLEYEVTQGFYETTPSKNGSRKRVVAMEILYGTTLYNY